MEVWGGRAACAAHQTYLLPFGYLLSDTHTNAVQMGINRTHAKPVVDKDDIAVAAVPTGDTHNPVGGGKN
ncbi:MAG: hypothetical protein DDT39_00442 [Firmicutes bacterium]|nr:hypothetical protein [candidate division NPL-UPA2 bacterium]